MQSSDGIWKLRSLTQQAATAPALWADVLSELSSAIGCDGAHIWMVGEVSPELRLSRQHGSMVDLHAEYGAHWAASDPWLGAALEKDAVRPGLAVAGTDVLLDRDLHRTPFYNDFARRVGVDSILALPIVGASDRDVPATLMSFKRSHRTFEQAANDKALLQALWPDLYGAVSAYWALRHVRDSERIVERTLDALPQPIWVIRGDLHIDYANVAAQALERAAGWIVAAGQRLRQIGHIDGAVIRHRLAKSGAGQCMVYRQISPPPHGAPRAAALDADRPEQPVCAKLAARQRLALDGVARPAVSRRMAAPVDEPLAPHAGRGARAAAPRRRVRTGRHRRRADDRAQHAAQPRAGAARQVGLPAAGRSGAGGAGRLSCDIRETRFGVKAQPTR